MAKPAPIPTGLNPTDFAFLPIFRASRRAMISPGAAPPTFCNWQNTNGQSGDLADERHHADQRGGGRAKSGTELEGELVRPATSPITASPTFCGKNTNGAWAAIWLMNGTTPTSETLSRSAQTLGRASWHVVGSGDFNGDGKSDILWQNTDGQAAIWLMNGTTPTSEALVGTNPGSSWQIVGTGDFTGDGKSDILFQNTSGQVAIWEMNGTTPIAEAVAERQHPKGRAGKSPGPATSPATASPTSCGRAPTVRRRSG